MTTKHKLKTKNCSSCHYPKPIEEFPVSTSAAGSPVTSRCRLCIAESSKKSNRQKYQLPAFKKLVASWPSATLESEFDWLTQKQDVVMHEIERRTKAGIYAKAKL